MRVALRYYFGQTSHQSSRVKPLLYHEKVPSTSIHSNEHVLILHGILGSGQLYKHLINGPQTLSKYSSYLPDLRNHGRSFWDDAMSMPEMAQDVQKWIVAEAFPNNSVTAIGHSLGGRVLISLTEQFPELQSIIKKVVIVDAAPHSFEGFPFVAQNLSFFDKLLKVDFGGSDQQIQDYLKSICSNEAQLELAHFNIDLQNRRFKCNLKGIVSNYNRIISYGCKATTWRGDVHVIQALRSQFITEQSRKDFTRLYRGLRNIVEVDCGHNVHLERPEEITRLLHI